MVLTGGKLLGMMALSGFVVAAGAFLLGVGVIALPTWGAYKLHKRLKERRRSHPRIKRSKHPIIFIPSGIVILIISPHLFL